MTTDNLRHSIGFISAVVAWLLCGGADTAYAQSSSLPEIKNKAIMHMNGLRCDTARELVQQFKKQAANPSGPQVVNLEQKLRRCFANKKEEEKKWRKENQEADDLMKTIETLIHTRKFGNAELKIKGFDALPKRAKTKYAEHLKTAGKAVENYWLGVTAAVTAGINTNDIQRAKDAVDQAKLQTTDSKHPRATVVEELKKQIAIAEAKAKSKPKYDDKQGTTVTVTPSGTFSGTGTSTTVGTSTNTESQRPVIGVVDTRPIPKPPTPATDIAGWTLVSIGGTAAIVGGIFLGLGYADEGEINSAEKKNSVVQDMTRVEAFNLVESAEWKLNTGMGFAIGGGAALLTGIILLALPNSDSSNVQWVPGSGSGRMHVSF